MHSFSDARIRVSGLQTSGREHAWYTPAHAWDARANFGMPLRQVPHSPRGQLRFPRGTADADRTPWSTRIGRLSRENPEHFPRWMVAWPWHHDNLDLRRRLP